MIAIAQERARASRISNVTFQAVAFEALQASNQTFGAVLGLSVLHLLDDLDDALSRIHQLLKPGGYFISSTVCVKDLSWPATWAIPIATAFKLAPTVRAFTSRELELRLELCGFSITYVWRPGPRRPVFIIARKQARALAA
jgi:2-polyprenyl-3-methyl-5-hydroxy-6-metoxy-1,4-benzoquinol methylase